MLNSILSAVGNTQIIMYVIIGVVLVLLVVMTIIPQKKRKKQQETMMNSLVVGSKIMTIGRMVGKITQVNSDNTLIINVGTEASPTLIVIDKNAVGLVLENAAQPVVTPAANPVADAPVADAPVEEPI
ncbi:MAG: preprotein translocase subunit YajC, partial [Clostridia bacterium]